MDFSGPQKCEEALGLQPWTTLGTTSVSIGPEGQHLIIAREMAIL